MTLCGYSRISRLHRFHVALYRPEPLGGRRRGAGNRNGRCGITAMLDTRSRAGFAVADQRNG